MKLILFTKKTLVIYILIILIIFFLSFIYYNSYLTISCNSMNFEESLNKVSNLTNGKEKIAYLTFDDGPTVSVTPKILDILKEEDIKASFFVIGKYVDTNPEIVRRAYNEGHYIANHGYTHNNEILYKSPQNFINEIKNTDLAISNAIGIENYCSYIFRFPNGFMAPQYKVKKKEFALLLSKMNYTYIDWNCLNNDSIKKYTPNQLLNNLKKSSKGKNTLVILMHDTKDVSNSSLILRDSIRYLKEQGYEFKNFYNILDNY